MADYTEATFAVDPDELKVGAFDFLRANVPGWEPSDGQLDVFERVLELVCVAFGVFHGGSFRFASRTVKPRVGSGGGTRCRMVRIRT